jgi:type IX secretion system PorP/SprF family membrane protein
MIRLISIFYLLALTIGNAISQDAHFSQFYASPLTLNPALAGAYDGTFRISTVYRDQWYSALDNSLRTFVAGGDAKFELNYDRSKNPDILGVGITFFSDRVGTFDFNTNQIMISTAFHKALNKRTKQYIGIGIQGGIFQKSLNYEDILFQDQFNSINGFNLGTSEVFPTNNRGYFDLSTGIYYSVTPRKGLSFNAGLGIFHLTQPNLSFYNEATIIDPNISQVDTLYRRFSVHTSLSIATSVRTTFLPRINALFQGKHSELNLGANIKYKADPQSAQYIHFGLHGRGVYNYDGFGLEAIIGMIGYERNNFILGISYDQALSKLINDRRSLSSLELSLIYIGDYHNEDSFCPQF